MDSERASKLEGCHLAAVYMSFAIAVASSCMSSTTSGAPCFFQASPVLRAAVATTREADRGHPGGAGGVDTCGAILDDETAVRRRRKVLCGI
jgi:hypothetical protein